jgi:hypothetical protein
MHQKAQNKRELETQLLIQAEKCQAVIANPAGFYTLSSKQLLTEFRHS